MNALSLVSLTIVLILLQQIADCVLLPGYWKPGLVYPDGSLHAAHDATYGTSDSGMESDVESANSLSSTVEADGLYSPRSSLDVAQDSIESSAIELDVLKDVRNRAAEYLTVVRGLDYFGRPSADFQRPDVDEIRELELELNDLRFRPLAAYHSLAFELLSNMSWVGIHDDPFMQSLTSWRQYEQAVAERLNEHRLLRYRNRGDVDVIWVPTSLWELFAILYDLQKKKPTFDNGIYGGSRRASYWRTKNPLVFSRRHASKQLKPRKKVYTKFLEFIQRQDANLLLRLSRRNENKLTNQQKKTSIRRFIDIAHGMVTSIAQECENMRPISMSPSFASFGSHGIRIASPFNDASSSSRYTSLHKVQSPDDLPLPYIEFIEKERDALTRCQRHDSRECDSLIASTIKTELEARYNDEVLLFRTTELHEMEVSDIERDARLAVWLRNRQTDPPFLQPIHELSSLHDGKTYVYEKPQNKAYTDFKPLLYSYSLFSGFLGKSFAMDGDASKSAITYAIKIPRHKAMSLLSSTFLLTEFTEHTLVWQAGFDRRPRTMYLAFGGSNSANGSGRTHSIQKLLQKRKIQVGAYVGDLNLLIKDNVRIVSFQDRGLWLGDAEVKNQFMKLDDRRVEHEGY